MATKKRGRDKAPAKKAPKAKAGTAQRKARRATQAQDSPRRRREDDEGIGAPDEDTDEAAAPTAELEDSEDEVVITASSAPALSPYARKKLDEWKARNPHPWGTAAAPMTVVHWYKNLVKLPPDGKAVGPARPEGREPDACIPRRAL
jgi:hypothetical protein